ncbi:MAG: hypothetical protein AB2693_21480, partial [Candidatus Thiodiazotropha sp.]
MAVAESGAFFQIKWKPLERSTVFHYLIGEAKFVGLSKKNKDKTGKKRRLAPLQAQQALCSLYTSS